MERGTRKIDPSFLLRRLDELENVKKVAAPIKSNAPIVKEDMEVLHQEVTKLHDSFTDIGNLCQQNRGEQDLPHFAVMKKLTIARNNLRSVIDHANNLCETGQKITEIQEYLQDDRTIFEAHRLLHSLEEIRNEALLVEHIDLINQFKNLDILSKSVENSTMKIFEECVNMAALRPATLVKVVMVIEREEKYDRERRKQNQNIQELKKQHKKESPKWNELEKSIQPIRGYRELAFSKLRAWILQHFEFAFADLEADLEITQDESTLGFALNAEVEDVTERYLSEANTILQDLKLVQDHMRLCMPKHYKILDFFLKQYHKQFYTLILRFANKASILSAKDTLNLVSWVKKTYEPFLSSVGYSAIEPSLIDPLEELIRGFRSHIMKLMEGWIPQLIVIDRKSPPEEVLGKYYTDSPVALFKIIKQQMQVVLITKYDLLTYQVVLECNDAITSFQSHLLGIYKENWRELEFEYIIALINNNKKAIMFVSNFEKLVMENLSERYADMVNFETPRQGFLALADASVMVLAKAICHDVEDTMNLIGTREWRDTADPYMDSICDTVVDYYENDVKERIDPDYATELYKKAMERIVDLYIYSLIHTGKHKCSLNDAFIDRLALEIEILYDFGTTYVSFAKFIIETLRPLKTAKKLFYGTTDDFIRSIKLLLDYQNITMKEVEFHVSRRSDFDRNQSRALLTACRELLE